MSQTGRNLENQRGPSGPSDEGLLPFPSLTPSSSGLGSVGTKQVPKVASRIAATRRTRADTLPSSFSYTFPFSAPPGIKTTPNTSELKPVPSTGIPTPTSIPALSRPPGVLRHRGATFSVPPSSLSGPFSGQPGSFSPFLNSSQTTPKQGMASVDESDQALARSLGYLGLDDPEPVNSEASRAPLLESRAISALRNMGRIRSRSFNVPVNYPSDPRSGSSTPTAGQGPAAAPPRMTLRQARARAISVGFLNQDELFDAFPELGALADEEDSDGGNSLSGQDLNREDYGNSEFTAPPPPPSRSLWVGNLDASITANELLALFSPYGPIESLRVLPDKECAFINFQSLDDAIRAKDDMQGGRMGSLNIRIGFGKADPTFASTGADMQTTHPTRALWIGNISASTSSAILQSIFSNFGTVESARVLVHKNCGFVNFNNVDEAQKARNAMNGKEISGSVVRIGYAKVPPQVETGTKSSRPIVPIPLNLLGIPVDSNEGESNGIAERVDTTFVQENNSTANETNSPTAHFDDDPYGVYEKGQLLGMRNDLIAFPYQASIPQLPSSNHERRIDQTILRERRKVLDSHPSPQEVSEIFDELYESSVDLCTDYIGNTVIQKLMEKGSDRQKQLMIEKVAPYMASIGCHKNGTWAVQKMIDCAHTPEQIKPIMECLKPYAPPLLLDQFGNYVIQCCLKFGPEVNQFIFDAIHSRFWDVVHGRFGTRAVRTCLDSKFTSKEQQKLVAIALVHHGLFLATDANGSILLTWLLDSSTISGRYRSLVPQFSVHLSVLCTHKLASLTILKIINQRVEPDARTKLIDSLFFSGDDSVLESVLSDQAYGLGLVQKILVSSCIDEPLKEKISEKVRQMLTHLQLGSIQSYRHLAEDLSDNRNNSFDSPQRY